MVEGIWIATIGLFAAPIAATITWFLNRNKEHFHSTSYLVDASSSAVDAIHEVLGVVRAENKALRSALDSLREQNKTLLGDNARMSKEIHQLRVAIEGLPGGFSEWTNYDTGAQE